MKKENVIKAFDDITLHLLDCRHTPCHTETELCGAPILLNEVQFTVVFGVKITQMPVRLDQLLKLRFLRNEIGLQKKDVSATAVRAFRGAAKTWALGKKVQVPLGPQTALPNDNLHALKPTGHRGVVFREIKVLWLAVWEGATVHVWTIRVVRPPFLRPCERSHWQPRGTKERQHTPFTIFHADITSGARF